MTIDPLRWGVLGVANIAVDKVVPAMQTSLHSPVVAIASRSPDRAERAARQLGIDRSYGSYEDLLADTEVDAVYVPLPNHLHERWTIAAAEAGKHVLCEKPLALTADAARRMIDACERSGVMLMEAFMYRLHPLWQAVVADLRRGTIGDVRAIQTAFCYFNDDPSDIRNTPDAGGGALYDVGCYAIDLARMVFESEPEAVHAAARVDQDLGTDVVTSALLDFGGRHATIVCGTQLEPAQRVEFLGTRGRVVVEIPFNIPPDQPTRFTVISGGDPPVAPNATTAEFDTCDPYTEQADLFSRAVRAGEPPPVDPHNAVGNLAVIETILATTKRDSDLATGPD